MNDHIEPTCPDCADTPQALTRRDFLRAAGGAVATAATVAAAGIVPARAYTSPLLPDAAKIAAPESVVKTLYNSLNEKQKEAVALGWENPARKVVQANW